MRIATCEEGRRREKKYTHTGYTHRIPVFVTSMHRTDRDKHLSGKRKGGGVCFMINNLCCNHNNIQELKFFCSPDLEFLTIKCRPFNLPREFSSVIVTVVYIPPPADTKTGLYVNGKPYILMLHLF